jgi:hypothetical protein
MYKQKRVYFSVPAAHFRVAVISSPILKIIKLSPSPGHVYSFFTLIVRERWPEGVIIKISAMRQGLCFMGAWGFNEAV